MWEPDGWFFPLLAVSGIVFRFNNDVVGFYTGAFAPFLYAEKIVEELLPNTTILVCIFENFISDFFGCKVPRQYVPIVMVQVVSLLHSVTEVMKRLLDLFEVVLGVML